MNKAIAMILFVLLFVCSISAAGANEIPIATTSGREMSISTATDGVNYLVAIQGDGTSDSSITAQLVAAETGSLVGARINVGGARLGGVPQVAFSGTNYLMVWEDYATFPNSHVYGRFINTSGALVGSPFVINDATGKQKPGDFNAVIFDGANFFVVWEHRSDSNSGESADVYGRFITPAGVLLGDPIPVSVGPYGQRMPTLAFDGANILIAWVDGRNQSACDTTFCAESDLYGQFVSKSSSGGAGALSGGNFLIRSSSLPHDGTGPSVAFDGTKYLVISSEETTLPDACPVDGCKWDVYGQFVTTAGVADGSRITISNTPPNHFAPGIVWNATLSQYMATWTENFGTDSSVVKARLFAATGSSIGNDFILFSKTDSGAPLFAGVQSSGAGYIALLTRAVSETNWDVYGDSWAPSVRKSDFNNDGNPDILWRHASTGENYVWYLDGVTVLGGGSLPPVADQNWKAVGTADFSNDGKPDILWRNVSSGENYIWYMDGVTVAGGGSLPTVADQNWTVVGVADFNYDENPDILWRNVSSGENYIWYLDGVIVAGGGSLPTVADQNWTVVGVADFNYDTGKDILWRNVSSGENYIWYLDGVAVSGGGSLPMVADQNWKLVGVEDFNHDAKKDVLWRNVSSGENYIWYLDGVTVAGGGILPTVADQNWTIVP